MRSRRIQPAHPFVRRLGLSALWTGCTLVTTVAGLSAVNLVGHEVSDRETSAMSPDAVTRAVAALPTPTSERRVPDPPAGFFGQWPRDSGSGDIPTADGDTHANPAVSPTPAPTATPTPTHHPSTSQSLASPALPLRQTHTPASTSSAKPTTRPGSSHKPPPTPSQKPSSTGVVRVAGGTVYLRCSAGQVFVQGAYPEDGYHVWYGDDHHRLVYIEFDHNSYKDAWQVWARCDAGEMHAVTHHVPDRDTPPSPTTTPSHKPSPSPSQRTSPSLSPAADSYELSTAPSPAVVPYPSQSPAT